MSNPAKGLKWREFQGGLTADTGTHQWYIMPANRKGWWKLHRTTVGPMKTVQESWNQPFEKQSEAKAQAEGGA